MAAVRDVCNGLMTQIISKCDDVFGHRETHKLSEMKCGNIRIHNNDSPVEVNKKLELLKIRSAEFHNCSDIRNAYTTHKPPCDKSIYDLSDRTHGIYNETLKTEGNYCDTCVERFIDTVNRNVKLYEANPSRRDLTFRPYVIYLYEKMKRDEAQRDEQNQLEKWKKEQTKKFQEIAQKASLELEIEEKLERERRREENKQKKSIEKEKDVDVKMERERERERERQMEREGERQMERERERQMEMIKKMEKKSQTKRNIKINKLVEKIKKINNEITLEFLLQTFPDDEEFISNNYDDIFERLTKDA
jgi:hypothetical protein